jgi:nucleotide-binding universal stress UspA family protein
MIGQQTVPRIDQAHQKYRRILVGYDGSLNSQRALLKAAALAREQEATLRVIVVVNPLMTSAPLIPPIPQGVFDDLMRNGNDLLSRALADARQVAPTVTGSVEEGYPADCILNMATRNQSDLVVLGRRGISGVERFLLGGVSSSVVSHSKCDVLIVR